MGKFGGGEKGGRDGYTSHKVGFQHRQLEQYVNDVSTSAILLRKKTQKCKTKKIGSDSGGIPNASITITDLGRSRYELFTLEKRCLLVINIG